MCAVCVGGVCVCVWGGGGVRGLGGGGVYLCQNGGILGLSRFKSWSSLIVLEAIFYFWRICFSLASDWYILVISIWQVAQ